MKAIRTWRVHITSSPELAKPLKDTLGAFRNAVDFFIGVIMSEWQSYEGLADSDLAVTRTERLTHRTGHNPDPKYDFDKEFYKFPSYLRRSAIREAYGRVRSYKSNLANWKKAPKKSRGKAPGAPKAGNCFPSLFHKQCFVRTGLYTAKLKAFVRNTWDWIEVRLRKSDMDYIDYRRPGRKEQSPKLCRYGDNWVLAFPFVEEVALPPFKLSEHTRIAPVDLGLNSAATTCIMEPDGAVIANHFLHLKREYDRLNHCIGKIIKANKHGSKKCPTLWAHAKAQNRHIAEVTANAIVDFAQEHGATMIVFEHLNLDGRKHGKKKWRLHHWRAKYVQELVTIRAHRVGIRVCRVNASGTSRYAFDGSGEVLRGRKSQKTNGKYSLCEFTTGKVYNCDLNAAKNIGARYFIRENLRNQSETARSALEAKVPALSKRSTCTLADLKALRAALTA